MPSDRYEDPSGSQWSGRAALEDAITGVAIPPSGSLIADSAVPNGAGPTGGEAASHGGMFRQIVSVFAENKLAVAGLVVIVGMVLFCFVGPFFYHTNQTNAQEALLNSTQNSPPGRGSPLGDRRLGVRHPRAASCSRERTRSSSGSPRRSPPR